MRDIDPAIQRLIDDLKATGRTQQEIADGAGVGYWYVNSFMQGRIKSPGWMKVERLRQFAQSNLPRQANSA